ncbi:hypothetical protein [Methanosarcina sp. 1.H.A.2.2]|uniref:hypothetical protein n=1 Tax=Methanosarcina sp. 1.H.A.2.2 TaxID=1483601 RepID=UPI0006212499|nr:hypothetical protein [Methanosarcina sp. 1.H.A.2.2]KKH50166.1 hypothetical protein EO93_04410 [Methanosarcina sp. 1.H.A.2.2]
MSRVVKRIEEIPEDIYSQIPSLIYNKWKPQFRYLTKHHAELINKKLRLPTEGECVRFKDSYANIYLNKADDDPFDLEYTFTFRLNLNNFKLVLRNFFKEHDIDFDFDLFYDKSRFLSNVSAELSSMLALNLTISIAIKYIEFVDHAILKTKSDIIEL